MCIFVYYRDRHLYVNVCRCPVFVDVTFCLPSLHVSCFSRSIPVMWSRVSRRRSVHAVFISIFFSFYFCVFLLICSDLHLSHCDLQISIWLHCLVNTTFQGYCYQVDLHQRKEEQKLIRTAQYHFIVHEFNSNCPWSLIFEAHRYKRCSLIAVSLLLSAYIQAAS